MSDLQKDNIIENIVDDIYKNIGHCKKIMQDLKLNKKESIYFQFLENKINKAKNEDNEDNEDKISEEIDDENENEYKIDIYRLLYLLVGSYIYVSELDFKIDIKINLGMPNIFIVFLFIIPFIISISLCISFYIIKKLLNLVFRLLKSYKFLFFITSLSSIYIYNNDHMRHLIYESIVTKMEQIYMIYMYYR